MMKGAAYYHMDDVNIIADIGRAFPRSKTNLLGLLFDPLNDFSMHNNTYAYISQHMCTMFCMMYDKHYVYEVYISLIKVTLEVM